MFNIHKAVRDAANSMYPKKIKMGLPSNLPLSNNRCHYNAVQAVKNNLAAGILEVAIIYKNDCTIHYVNVLPDGTCVDFTLGVMCINDDYRFIRHVSPNEYDTINKTLRNAKDKLYASTPWYIQKLIKLSGKDWC